MFWSSVRLAMEHFYAFHTRTLLIRSLSTRSSLQSGCGKQQNRREISCRGNSIPQHLDVRAKAAHGHHTTALVGAGQDKNLQNLALRQPRSGEDHRSKQKQAVQPDLAQGSQKKPNGPHQQCFNIPLHMTINYFTKRLYPTLRTCNHRPTNT